MAWWYGVRSSAWRWLCEHGPELGTCAALAFPALTAYLRVPLIIVAWGTALVLLLLAYWSGIVGMRKQTRLRICHGIEHATFDLLALQNAPVWRGLAHDDHFVLSFTRDEQPAVWIGRVRETTEIAIARFRGGDSVLAYGADCGTSASVALLLRLAGIGLPGVALHLLGAAPHVMLLAILFGLRTSQAIDHPVGILTQRWFTVSVEFESAAVVDILTDETDDGYDVRVMLDVVPRAS